MQAISVRKTNAQWGKIHSEGAIYFQASFLLHKHKAYHMIIDTQ